MRRALANLALALLLPWAALAQGSDDDGPGFLAGLIEDNLSSAGREVRIRGFQGALSSRATLDEMTIADEDGVWLTLRGAVLDWDRSALFSGRLVVNELTAEELIVPRLPAAGEAVDPPPATASGFRLPELPVAIDIGRLAIVRATLGEQLFGAAAEITFEGSVGLADGAGAAELSVERIDGRRGRFAVDAAFANATEALRLDVTLSEAEDGIAANLIGLPGRPSVDMSIAGEGELSDLGIDLRLATDGQDRLSGTVTLLAEGSSEDDTGPTRRFRADLGGDIAPVFTPQYRPFFGPDIRLQVAGARAPDGRLVLDEFALQADSLALEGTLEIAADGLPRRFALTGEIADGAGAPVLLPFGTSPTRIGRADLTLRFDAGAGDTWTGRAVIAALDRPEVDAERLSLEGSGVIRRDPDSGAFVTADLRFAGEGVALANAAAGTALGDAVTGAALIEWQQGAPVVLDRLELTGAGYRIAASGQLEGADRDLAVMGEASAEIDDLAPFSALAGRSLGGRLSASVAGSAEALGGAFDVSLTGEGEDLRVGIPQVDGLIGGSSEVRLVATRDATGTRVETFRLASDALTASGGATLREADSLMSLDVRLAEVAAVLPGLAGEATLAVDARQRDETNWAVEIAAGGPGATALTLTGTLTDPLAAPAFSGDIRAALGDLSAFSTVAGRDLAGRVEAEIAGSAALDGTVFDLRATGRADGLVVGIDAVDGLAEGGLDFDAAARREGAAILVDRARLTAANARAEGSARIEPLANSVTLDVALGDLARLVPQLSGSATLIGAVSQLSATAWAVDLIATGPGNSRATVAGTVSEPFALPSFDGDASLAASDLSAFRALAGRDVAGRVEAELTGSGALDGSTFDVDATLDATDLKVGVPQADALTEGDAALRLSAGREDGTIRVEAFRLSSDHVEANGAALLGATGGGRIDLDARLTDVARVLPRLSGAAQLNANAAQTGPQAWTVDLQATAPGGAEASVTGTLSDPLSGPAFDGRVRVAAEDLGAYSALAGRPVGGGIEAQAEGRVAVAERSYDIEATVDGRNLRIGQAEANRLLAGESRLEAAVSGKGSEIAIERFRAETPNLTASAEGRVGAGSNAIGFAARLADLGLLADGVSGPLSVDGRVGQTDGGDWQLSLAADGPAGSTARVGGTVATDGTRANLDIDGSAPLALAGRFIAPNSVQGQLTFDLALDGAPGLGALSGTVATSGARVVVPSPGIVLNALDATATMQGGRAGVTAAAQVQGGGRVALDGSVILAAPFAADLTARLAAVTVSDPALYETMVDGAVSVTGPLTGGAAIAGTLTLDRTEVQIPSSGFGATGEIPEIAHVNEPAAVRATRARAGLLGGMGTTSGGGPAYGLDITLLAPSQVFVRGRGLDAELGGRLRLSGTTANVIPAGQFELVRGRLDILGQRFTLDEGLARLEGAFVPFIRLVSSTSTPAALVQIVVQGPASSPDIQFVSQPELPQDEVLALLLFGRGITEISPLQAAQLASAVATLAGRGGVGILGRLRDSFGLDDLDVTADGNGGTAVRAGRYISDNIYTDVTIGSSESEINLNLDISRNVTAKGRVTSTGETGVGIFFERDY